MGRLFWIVAAAVAAGLIVLVMADSSGSEIFGLDTDSFGHLIYLGALGALLASGVLASGQRFGQTVRTLALWFLVILVLMAGYEYRYELQDVASRVSGGLVPGSPLSITDGDGRTIVTLRQRIDGHFEANVDVNGRTISTIVDTGATSTVLTAADAERAGFDPAALNFNIPVSTANGTANAARVVADEVVVGGIVRKNLPLLVAEDGRLGQSLLGMNFMGTLSGFDVRGDRLVLRD
ncbi:MAG: TIGR02281 family clan AA aspartic protease [Pseudomonadota bacterium]|nr:TIGR02281 family clan AA aspartic protease [Pseudomonadota bacterium]MDQ2704129.1 TIGR02281 family clan AA aspartic protease [Pseudomonadota bacterium]